MRRREFLSGLGGVAAWPVMPRAQEVGRIYRLGFMIPNTRETPSIVAFFDELRLNGFIEGQNVAVVEGSFQGRNDQLAELAAIGHEVPAGLVLRADKLIE